MRDSFMINRHMIIANLYMIIQNLPFLPGRQHQNLRPKGLRSLILADNLLTCHVPSSSGNLSKFYALDLSQNKLSGEIPLELKQPTFLSFFNMYYHKDLMGSTPQGKQFSVLNNNPYEGNSCGSLLSKKCETSPSPSSFDEDHESESSFEFGWKPVVMGVCQWIYNWSSY